ncbi:hypothetical protein LOZ52_002918 [Ophidiomyces ophidiicola]|nr:hypothetical protein LOZ52_002918 [Ophidiomyces ophidiicola]
MAGGFHPPPAVMASWPRPNYVNPPTRGEGVMIVALVLGVLMLIFVSLRVWVRFRVQREPGVDDYIVLAAVVRDPQYIAFQHVTMFWSNGGVCLLVAGHWPHYYSLPDQPFTPRVSSYLGHAPEEFRPDSKAELDFTTFHRADTSFFLSTSFLLSNILTKISILVLYLRVIKGTANKIFLHVVRVAIAILVLYGVSGVVLLCLMCQPLDAYWLQFDLLHPPKGYTCWDESILPMYAVFFNLCTDLMTTILPMFLFKQLKMPTREKLSLAAVFGVGFIVCISSIIRAYYYHYVFFKTYDITWLAYDVWMWTVVECHLGIIVACAPPLRPLFKRFLQTAIYGSYGDHSYGSRAKNSKIRDEEHDGSHSYALKEGVRRGKSTEWDKDSNSSSMPLERPAGSAGVTANNTNSKNNSSVHHNGILRTDNFEISYNQSPTPQETHAHV